MSAIAALVGRILLAVIFLVSGASKLIDPAGTEAMITGVGLPSGLAIPTGVFEIVAGLAIVLGFMTRLFAILLAGFCLVTIAFFHNEFQDPMQAAMAMKNLAMAGGFLCLFAVSQMRWSYDSMRLTRKAEIARRDGDVKVHEAELRAVKAEAEAEALRNLPHHPAPVVVAPVAPAPMAAAPVAPAAVAPTVVAPNAVARPAPAVDRDHDGVDDRIQRALDQTPHIEAERAGQRTLREDRIDRDRDGIDDRDQSIDPRLRP